MANPSEQQSTPLLTDRHREAANWEYRFITGDTFQLLQDAINDAAKQGWEPIAYQAQVIMTTDRSGGAGLLTALARRHIGPPSKPGLLDKLL